MTRKIAVRLKQIENLTKERVSQVQRKVFFELSKQIINMTPVDTGRARANWQGNVNGFKPGEVKLQQNQRLGREASASVAEASVLAAMAVHDHGDSLNLGNNLEYIEFLDKGSSTQAPAGIVDVALNNFRPLVHIEAAKVNR